MKKINFFSSTFTFTLKFDSKCNKQSTGQKYIKCLQKRRNKFRPIFSRLWSRLDPTTGYQGGVVEQRRSIVFKIRRNLQLFVPVCFILCISWDKFTFHHKNNVDSIIFSFVLTFNQCCGSSYIEFGSGSRIMAQFGSGFQGYTISFKRRKNSK